MNDKQPDAIYPDAPGFKVAGPSQEAAKIVARPAKILLWKVKARLAELPGGATADEIAAELNASVLSVRPRVSELNRLGLIEKTAARRKNASGMTATVWRLVRQEGRAEGGSNV